MNIKILDNGGAINDGILIEDCGPIILFNAGHRRRQIPIRGNCHHEPITEVNRRPDPNAWGGNTHTSVQTAVSCEALAMPPRWGVGEVDSLFKDDYQYSYRHRFIWMKLEARNRAYTGSIIKYRLSRIPEQ